MQLGLVPELGHELRPEQVEELGLGEAAAFELEQRVLAVALGDPLHRSAEGIGGNSGLVLERQEGAKERRREDASEVGDKRADRQNSEACGACGFTLSEGRRRLLAQAGSEDLMPADHLSSIRPTCQIDTATTQVTTNTATIA